MDDILQIGHYDQFDAFPHEVGTVEAINQIFTVISLNKFVIGFVLLIFLKNYSDQFDALYQLELNFFIRIVPKLIVQFPDHGIGFYQIIELKISPTDGQDHLGVMFILFQLGKINQFLGFE